MTRALMLAIHINTELVVAKSRAIAGSATFTTSMSRKMMKVVIERNPRMSPFRGAVRVGWSMVWSIVVRAIVRSPFHLVAEVATSVRRGRLGLRSTVDLLVGCNVKG